jgi:YVTN family beta-propeller protein
MWSNHEWFLPTNSSPFGFLVWDASEQRVIEEPVCRDRQTEREPMKKMSRTLGWVLLGLMAMVLGAMSASATQLAYVTNNGSNTVSVIDRATNTVVATIPVGPGPYGVAVTPDGAYAYVANYGSNNLSVIATATNTVVATVPVGAQPWGVTITPDGAFAYATNATNNTVSVVATATHTVVATVPVGVYPAGIAVTPDGAFVYVANYYSNTVSVIATATNAVVTTVPVGPGPTMLAITPNGAFAYVALSSSVSCICVSVIATATNTVVANIPQSWSPYGVAITPDGAFAYVANGGSNATLVIATASNTVAGTVPVGSTPWGVAVTPDGAFAYVTNSGSNNVSVIDTTTNTVVATINVGSTPVDVALASTSPIQFVPVTPCRLADTRPQYGGDGPIQGGSFRNFPIPQEGGCNIPSNAGAYSLNVSAVPSGPLGYLTIWPTGGNRPGVATLNSLDGRIKANAAIVSAGVAGAISVYATNTTNVVLDINGYFAPPSGSTLAFYPLTPCRVADTRKDSFPAGLGSPHLLGTVERDLPVLSSSCIPAGINAQAYSFNFAAVPYPALGHPLGYLEVWPTGQKPQQPVSTLNNLTGTIVANAAIVRAGTGGEITVLATNDTDLVIDLNGYFAAPGPGGLSLYPVAPCRVLDTRKVGDGQPFSGLLSPPVDVVNSPCGLPSSAQAYVFNATVVPVGLGYLTLWPDGEAQPVVSTLSAIDGWIASNMAIVPSTNGKIDAYASGITQLILDISGYFGP